MLKSFLDKDGNKIDQTEEKNFHENSSVDRQEKIERAGAPKKKGTKPGWRPSGQLPRLKAPEGFVAKWCNPAKVSERLVEGWTVMRPSDNRGDRVVNVDVNDSASLSGELRYRDLIAMMLPVELKEARDEWLQNEKKSAMSGILRKTDEELKEGGVQTYHPSGQAGRVVIE